MHVWARLYRRRPGRMLLEAFLPAFRTRMSGYHPVVLVLP